MSLEDDAIRMKRQGVIVRAEVPTTPSYLNLNLPSSEERQAKWNAKMMRDALKQQGKNLVDVITQRVKELESTLAEGETLEVLYDAGPEQIRVQSFEFPNWHLAIIIGVDVNDNPTQRIENIQEIKLTCKTMKANKRGPKIGFILPKQSDKTEA